MVVSTPVPSATERDLDYLTDGWCQGDEDLALEQKRAIIAGAVVNGLVFVAKYEDEDLVGVVAIFGPGNIPLST